MTAEQLDQDRMTAEAVDVEWRTRMVGRDDRGQRLSEREIRILSGLTRQDAEPDPCRAECDSQDSRYPPDPPGLAKERDHPECDTQSAGSKRSGTPALERDGVGAPEPNADRDRHDGQGKKTQDDAHRG